LDALETSSAFSMHEKGQFDADLRALRELCDESIPRERRQRLVQSLALRAFAEPEHQVVFESIRALLFRGSISIPRLRLHLNNRGFCDTNVETYFQPAIARTIGKGRRDEGDS
jgi:hypothetical protein